MDKNILEARIRQLLAIDKNAFDLYSDLGKNIEDPDLKDKFLKIARDEKRHVALSEEMISLLNR